MSGSRNNTVLMTGGAQGPALQMALAVVREGAAIVLCDSNPESLAAGRRLVEALGVRALACPAGVTGPDASGQLRGYLP